MNQHRLAVGIAMALLGLTAACGGSDVPAETPEAPPAAAPEPAAAPPPPAEAEPAADAKPADAKPAEAPPAAKPLKERIVKQWTGALSPEAKTKAEEAAKKKAGKDEAKAAELLKADEDKAAKEWIEFTADGNVILYAGAKPTSKAKYEIVKEEGSMLVIKLVGKDEITKKDAPKDEITITMKDADAGFEWKAGKTTKHFSAKM